MIIYHEGYQVFSTKVHRDIKQNGDCQKLGEKANGELFQFYKMKRVLEMDGGGSCIT